MFNSYLRRWFSTAKATGRPRGQQGAYSTGNPFLFFAGTFFRRNLMRIFEKKPDFLVTVKKQLADSEIVIS
jgi:hypothetical protein